jgi:hypothetical protein
MNQELMVFSAIEQFNPKHRDWYRLHDTDRSAGAIRIVPDEAEAWNRKGWGIFHTVNSFRGARKTENLAAINAWAIDIDCAGAKDACLELVKKSPLYPSLVVETGNGYHVYWNARNARPETYATIVAERLLPHFKADPRAKDVSRLLRVPGFLHQKDPRSPFLVRVVSWEGCAYTEAEMMYAFRAPKKPLPKLSPQTQVPGRRQLGSTLWPKVFAMNCVDALNRLSGTHYVQGEVYSFKPVSRGHLNIYVNGKSTSCFIDTQGRIGSADHGGPTVANWLKWYGRSWSEVVQIMRLVFPEMFDDEI